MKTIRHLLPLSLSQFMRRLTVPKLAVVAFTLLVLAGGPQEIEAGLIIKVVDDRAADELRFSWNGTIGDSGTSVDSGNRFGSDFIRPRDGRFFAADRSRTDVTDGWRSNAEYQGVVSVYGTGLLTTIITDFRVTGNTPFAVGSDGVLAVGSLIDGGSATAPLDNHVFTGSFTLPGEFSDYGLFDTPATDITSGPVTLWTANNGSGSIAFSAAAATVPEPSSMSILAMGTVVLVSRKKRRTKPMPA